MSYNYAFTLIGEIAPTPFIGFANSDIIFSEDLILSLEAVYNKWTMVNH